MEHKPSAKHPYHEIHIAELDDSDIDNIQAILDKSDDDEDDDVILVYREDDE